MQPVRTFYSTGEQRLVAPNKHATILLVGMKGDGDAGIERVIHAVDAGATDGFETAITGEFTADHDFTQLSQQDLEKGELEFGLPVALIVLVLVFGAVVAGLIPVLVALVSIVIALGLTALVGQAFDLSVYVVNMISGMGLALGIDYSLFVVSRFREERRLGGERLDAIATVGSTTSRAVLFSGSAFVLAMLGMVLVPDTILRSLATGAVLVGDRHRARRADAVCRRCSRSWATASTRSACRGSAVAPRKRRARRDGSGRGSFAPSRGRPSAPP